ncbi:sensor domain-containing diguanylate cyclase [uncultured Psychromonas sp.]|uniref:sensor domain-containing diguanylate cyclase n=1 Tax=uncultured Psychromonas sp. TaxID=173974 RepID=UPI002625FB85|nr:sensor domain-containing diguanylate cyclase [uncultured Psychromonas sp.]
MSGFSEQLLIEPHYGVVVHRNFEPLYSDDNYARFYGYKSAQDILSLTSILELISPADHPKALQIYQDLMSGKQKPGVRTYKNIDKDNNELTVLAIDNIVDWEGVPAMQVIIIDFSYQFETQRNLMLSEERYRVLVDGSIQGILVHNNFKPLFCNNAYAQMFGFESEQALLETDSILALIPSEFHDQAYLDNRSLLAGDESVIKTESKGIRIDGSIVWVSLLSRTVIWDGAPATQITVMDITEQQLLRERLEHRANYDVLTNLLTRRAFNELLEKEFTYAQQHSNALCCVLIDIDNFKNINDKNGHRSGDIVLQSFASAAKKNLRESDFIGRWGGDEFVLILPKTDIGHAKMIADRLCNDLANLSIDIDNGNLSFSVSIGVSSFSEQVHNVETLLSEADKALYQAKHQGKGRVAVAS